MAGEPSALANLGLHVGGPLIGGVLAACVFYVQERHVESRASKLPTAFTLYRRQGKFESCLAFGKRTTLKTT